MLNEGRLRQWMRILMYILIMSLSPSMGYAVKMHDTYMFAKDLHHPILVEASSTTFPIQEWKGKYPMDKNALSETIEMVYNRLPLLEYSDERGALLLETVATESDIGVALEYKGNYGVTQFRISSAKYLLNWLRKKHPEMHVSIMDMYDPTKTMRENLKFNVPFNLAMCATYYWHRNPSLDNKSLSTITKRSRVWKKYYNTSAGSGTPQQYVKRSIARLSK